jgi:hypothetical protein
VGCTCTVSIWLSTGMLYRGLSSGMLSRGLSSGMLKPGKVSSGMLSCGCSHLECYHLGYIVVI